MKQAYGKGSWDTLWEKLEQEGNVGLDYVINPVLYKEVVQILSTSKKALVVDFGCGTNLMGIQLLYGYADSIPSLRDLENVRSARSNTLLYIGLEGQAELVKKSRSYLKDLGYPPNLATMQVHIGEDEDHQIDLKEIDLCVSRQFLMHLSTEDYKNHLENVSNILKADGYYVFSILNPDYEQMKSGSKLTDGERYEFVHGKQGEHGTFYHYYKTVESIESAFSKFNIMKKIACMPITNRFKQSHSRYYNQGIPMGYVYVLRKKSN